MNRKVFTVIVTCNGLRWLEKTLGSLGKSTYATSIIVVDNHSSDGTGQFIRDHFPDVILIESPRNLGFGRANNIGIKEALKRKANYFFLLNQDASVYPGAIERLVELLSVHRDFGILSPMHLDGTGKRLDYGFSQYINPPGCEALLSHLVLNGNDLLDIYPLEFVNAAAWMISRECLERVGGFDPLFFMYGEDNDYIDRARGKGFNIGVVPGIYISHDRSQRNQPAKHSIKKGINWQWSRSLIRLKKNCAHNNSGFAKAIAGEYIFMSKQIIKSFLTLDFKKTAVFIVLLVQYTLLLPAVSRSRKICREKSGAYIEGIGNGARD